MLTIHLCIQILLFSTIIIYKSFVCEEYSPVVTAIEDEDGLRLKRVIVKPSTFAENVKYKLPSHDLDLQNDVKYFDSIVESPSTQKSSTKAINSQKLKRQKVDKNFNEIKALLIKLMDKMKELEKEKRDDSQIGPTTISQSVSLRYSTSPSETDHLTNNVQSGSHSNLPASKYIGKMKKKKDDQFQSGGSGLNLGSLGGNRMALHRPSLSSAVSLSSDEGGNTRRQRWGHWTEWSSCSVTCGKGRQIRWRHCVENCDEAETEMEEKTCQLPACGPGKLFGVIQL